MPAFGGPPDVTRIARRARFALAFLLAAQTFAQHGPHLLYEVEVKPDSREAFHFALTISRPGVDEVALSVPAWAPGSYRLLKAADGVKDVGAVDDSGLARKVVYDGAQTWRVESKGAASLKVSWRFDKLAKRKDNRSFMAQGSALLDGPRNYLYWRDHKHLPAHVTFRVPEGWTVASGLHPTFDPSTFLATDADFLIDCPVLMGELVERRFTSRGIPHRVVLDLGGKKPEFDLDAFVDGCRRIVEAGADLMGGLPYEHYTFLFVAGGGGGLEHLTSTTIGVEPTFMKRDPNAHKGVTAHEHFHAWNVKRLRPAALGPFDYDGPVRTKSLWFAEGVTDYYTDVILARAGLMKEEEFFDTLGTRVASHVRNEASRAISPEENSWTVWDGVYMGGPISYYDQGAILGFMMDLEIRGRTENRRSLDDAMRLLYRRHSGARGFQSEDLVVGIYDATGVDLHDFFLRHVSAAQEPDWRRYFAHAGYDAASVAAPTPALTFSTEAADGKGVRLKELAKRSAAARLGLREGDVVTAIDGTPTPSTGRLARAVRGLTPGSKVSIDVLRDGGTKKIEGVVEAATELGRLRFRGEGAPAFDAPRAGSALDAAGVREGDVLVSVDGEKTPDGAAAEGALKGVAAGSKVELVVLRGGAETKVVVFAEPRDARRFSFERRQNPTPLQTEIRRGLTRGVSASAPVRKAG
jgi:predicted metalloprotease with PDZ domain